MRRLLLISSSVYHDYAYLEYCKSDILAFLNSLNVKHSKITRFFFHSNNVNKLLFIPYALADYDSYANKVKKAIEPWGINIQSIHEQDNPKSQLRSAQAIFVGGGNTFKLLNTLYKNGLIETIRKRVLEEGMPYIGSSAGTNVSTLNICTTNDMPIEYPPSFEALKLVPFNINPHYLDPIPESKHNGETREERIRQYLEVHPDKKVIGLREGCHMLVEGDNITLKGLTSAILFKSGAEAENYETGSDLSFLLQA